MLDEDCVLHGIRQAVAPGPFAVRELQVRALNVMPGGGHLGVDTVCFSEGDRGGHHMSQLIVGPYT